MYTILNLGTRWSSVVSFTPWLLYPGEGTVVSVQKEAGWVPEAVWTLWRRDKSHAPTQIQTPDCPAHSLVTRLAMLSQLK